MITVTIQGKLIENAIRKRGVKLSSLAKQLNVNRRTLYNWFHSADLKKELIHEIGVCIGHDFSEEFPDMFTSDMFFAAKPRPKPALTEDKAEPGEWKNKYIALLEKYTETLALLNSETDEQSKRAIKN
ncbi:hypothetical protein IM792_15780 [Mucilaginibacter sp. JRF]|uniref:hypothetical protein n=1 Tax=Mucilaginibacter sp. JRF TaxID=2780088 RepID=UPI0018806E5B|nr:hypothetical protein [Mucilaginibacter sp. JRF]MBE9585917.1 hypothetical protein [Mucilaginibacter sp. JRF]